MSIIENLKGECDAINGSKVANKSWKDTSLRKTENETVGRLYPQYVDQKEKWETGYRE